MVLLRGDWERDYQGSPPIFATGTVGEMVRMEELPDGRFNIVLRGLREYTILGELHRAAYREARVGWRDVEEQPLPGGMRFGYCPRGEAWQWVKDGQALPLRGGAPLNFDVFPAQRHRFELTIGAPSEPGTHVLEVTLVGKSVRSFATPPSCRRRRPRPPSRAAPTRSPPRRACRTARHRPHRTRRRRSRRLPAHRRRTGSSGRRCERGHTKTAWTVDMCSRPTLSSKVG